MESSLTRKECSLAAGDDDVTDYVTRKAANQESLVSAKESSKGSQEEEEEEQVRVLIGAATQTARNAFLFFVYNGLVTLLASSI